MQLKFTYTRILIDQFVACFEFYKHVMGFTVTWGEGDEDYAEFDAGATRISINKNQHVAEAVGKSDKPFTADIQDHVMLVFEVENVDATYAELVKRGATSVTAPQDRQAWGVRTAHFRDPAGTLIEINQGLDS